MCLSLFLMNPKVQVTLLEQLLQVSFRPLHILQPLTILIAIILHTLIILIPSLVLFLILIPIGITARRTLPT
jgi:hypothetical protein